jgi:hypothetical protein
LKKQITNQLTKNLLLTFCISAVLTFFAIQIFYAKEAGSLEGNSGIFILTLASIFWVLVLTISSLTVFLNHYEKIRDNKINSILSFFLLPILLPIIFFLTSEFGSEWNSFFIVTFIFLLTHLYFFIKFSKTDLSKN